jgi:hypothetical protein
MMGGVLGRLYGGDSHAQPSLRQYLVEAFRGLH